MYLRESMPVQVHCNERHGVQADFTEAGPAAYARRKMSAGTGCIYPAPNIPGGCSVFCRMCRSTDGTALSIREPAR